MVLSANLPLLIQNKELIYSFDQQSSRQIVQEDLV